MLKAVPVSLRSIAAALLLTLGAGTSPLLHAAEATLDNPDALSLDVGLGLNEVLMLSDAGRFEDAATALQQVRDKFAERLNAYEEFRILKVSAYLNTQLRKYPEAIADYAAILTLNGLPAAERESATELTAQLYVEQQEWDKAVEYLVDLDKLRGGKDGDTLSRIAFAYGQLQRFTDAIPYMEKALDLAGERATEDDYNNMAILYIRAEKPTEAIGTYEKFLAEFPESANREAASANLAALYVQVRDSVKARALLRTLIREYPDSERLPTYRQSLTALGG